jgi:hypothetical protein
MGNTKRGDTNFDKTALGLWASIGPDLDQHPAPKQPRNGHLKIDQGKGSGAKQTWRHADQRKDPVIDPVDFLMSLEKKNTNQLTFNTAKKISLKAVNSPSLRQISRMEGTKWKAQVAYENYSNSPVRAAHDSPTSWERTALGLFATLPAKDHGPGFLKREEQSI